MNELIFHIAIATDWAENSETYRSPRFETEGFIHCSTARQLEGVEKQRFLGRDDLLVLSIDPARVRSQLRFENSEDGTEKFPHIYGPLNVDGVVATRPLRISRSGELKFQEAQPKDT